MSVKRANLLAKGHAQTQGKVCEMLGMLNIFNFESLA